MLTIDRTQVLAYRISAQGLHRDTAEVTKLAVLDLGVQDTPPGSAAQAIAVRLGKPADLGHFTTTWTARGAPHVHRVHELPALSRALWPRSDADALVRLDTSSGPVRGSGMAPREALRFVAEAIADIVTEPLPKGEVSTALTPRIPAAMTVDCRVCKATHIVETLFRTAVLPAGITFDPTQRTVTFVPTPGWPGVPADTDGLDDLISTYLRLHGPSTPEAVASFLGTRAAEVTPHWPEGLAEVEVDGAAAWLPHDAVDALRSPEEPPDVRLLPPSDPFLQARDRELLVPEAAHRKAIWPILGRPGVLLVHGEVAGTWRARKKGRRLEVTLQPFGDLPASLADRLAEEATLLAQARGLIEAVVG